MSGPVDVLAWFDRELDGWEPEAPEYQRTDAARAAVAELIEADREWDAAREDLAKQRRQVGAVDAATHRWHCAEKRRAAALSRITQDTP